MGNKIVTIVMTIFMLVVCVVILTTMSMVNMKVEQDHVIERATGSVLSTDGEIKESSTVTVSGADLISSIVGMSAIDNRIPLAKDKVYSYKEIDGTYQSRYILTYSDMSDKNEILASLQPTEIYTLTYTFDDENNSARVVIEKGVGS